MAVSPTKAAKIAGVSRTTVMLAIKERELNAVKKNNGHWSIEDDELESWLQTRLVRAAGDRTAPATPERPTVDSAELSELWEELSNVKDKLAEALADLAAAKTRADALDERVADLKGDRDDWKRQAEALASRPVETVSFFRRLFGR